MLCEVPPTSTFASQLVGVVPCQRGGPQTSNTQAIPTHVEVTGQLGAFPAQASFPEAHFSRLLAGLPDVGLSPANRTTTATPRAKRPKQVRPFRLLTASFPSALISGACPGRSKPSASPRPTARFVSRTQFQIVLAAHCYLKAVSLRQLLGLGRQTGKAPSKDRVEGEEPVCPGQALGSTEVTVISMTSSNSY